MTFKEDSMLVKNAILLLTAGIFKSIDDVPDVGNFREVVQRVMEQ